MHHERGPVTYGGGVPGAGVLGGGLEGGGANGGGDASGVAGGANGGGLADGVAGGANGGGLANGLGGLNGDGGVVGGGGTSVTDSGGGGISLTIGPSITGRAGQNSDCTENSRRLFGARRMSRFTSSAFSSAMPPYGKGSSLVFV